MMITTVQKVIKIGTSRGVTIPAKDLRVLGVETGDDVLVTIKPAYKEEAGLRGEYESFKVQYGETLKNLTQR